MLLGEVPFQDLKVGDRVISTRGRPGVISAIYKERHWVVDIEWSQEPPWDQEEQVMSSGYQFQIENSKSEYLGQ